MPWRSLKNMNVYFEMDVHKTLGRGRETVATAAAASFFFRASNIRSLTWLLVK